eukprot:jgi/Ulvmu1/4172/UM019_0151.1
MIASRTMSRYIFFPFVTMELMTERALTILTDSVRALSVAHDSEFLDVITSDGFQQFLDTFLRFSWRPHDYVELPQSSRSHIQYTKLRQQVLDVLCRAAGQDQRSRCCPVILELSLSPSAVIDICTLYAYDAQAACSNILRALMHSNGVPVAIASAISAAGSHIEQVGDSLGSSREHKASFIDLVTCMEDIAASLVATLLVAPQISRDLISNTGRPLLPTLSHWHDNLLPQLNAKDNQANALALACAWLAFQVIQHGVLLVNVTGGDGSSCDKSIPSLSDELLPLLMDMKSVQQCSDSRSLLGRLAKYGLLQLVDQFINDSLMDADHDEYAYLLALVGQNGDNAACRPHAAMPPAMSTMKVLSSMCSAPQRRDDAPASSLDASQRRMLKVLQDMLPDHSPSFLHACCQCIGWNIENVANALLTNALPVPLQQLDRTCVGEGTRDAVPAKPNVPNYGRRQLDLDSGNSRKDLVNKTLSLLQSQETEDAEYNDEYDDSFDALGGHAKWDGEAEAEISMRVGVTSVYFVQ